ncbi:hypothetical protein J6590_108338 [Homalodisca vitripennis]|nr:hypothetical protein J6590_108338 [Homalodisca vitripennis]
MSELSRSSAIRNVLDELDELSDIESDSNTSDIDTDLEDCPNDCDNVLVDLLSGSGEEYQPQSDSDTSDNDQSVSRSSRRPIPVHSVSPQPGPSNINNDENEHSVSPSGSISPPQSPSRQSPVEVNSTWVRAYPPEDPVDVAGSFQVRNTGGKNLPPRNSLPIQYFYLFFSDFIWSLLTKETNAYASVQKEKKRNSGNMKTHSRLSKWTDVTKNEMKRYLALIINMGLTVRNNYKHYWSTIRSQKLTFFSENMSLHRFQIIRANFHISSLRAIPKNHPGHDPWYKIREFYNSLNDSFKKYFTPDQNISLDESMVGMKNRCSFIQYLPNKRHARFGVKKFELCDSKTSYVLHSELYSGKGFLADGSDDAFTQKVVLHIMNKCRLLKKNYHLYTDNYYTKLPLVQTLLDNQTYLSGTINKNSKGICKTLIEMKLQAKESVYFRKNKILLVGYKEKKTRKPVYLISSALHADDRLFRSKKSGIEAIKPVVINEYNLHMGGVDNKDKSIYHLTCTRPSKKYWVKIFENFLDMALLNSYILYKQNTDKPMDRHHFTVMIVESLIDDSKEANDSPPQANPGPAGDMEHKLIRLPGVRLRKCVVCSTKQKISRSHYWCPACNSGVHPTCYGDLKHFWRPSGGGKRKRKTQEEVDSD